jgi:RNA polymerase sigma-70 factor (family 1)
VEPVNSDIDVNLVKDLSKGNVIAFNRLFKNYCNRIYYFSFGYLKSESEAEEIVQEVFTIIWEKRSALKEELSFKSYVFTIAYNIIKKHFRRKALDSKYFETRFFDELDIDTSNKISYNSTLEFIKKLVDQMPERRKQVFIKSRFEGLNIKEICELLNISHKTVENHLTEALSYLRKNLKNEGLSALLFFILFIS